MYEEQDKMDSGEVTSDLSEINEKKFKSSQLLKDDGKKLEKYKELKELEKIV